MAEQSRWSAVAHYRTSTGLVDVHYDIEELADLQDLIERGPDWRSIERISIVLARGNDADIVAEEQP